MDEALTDTIRKQKRIENKIARDYESTIKQLRNPYVKAMLQTFQLESRKHAVTLQSILDKESGEVTEVSDVWEMRSVLTKHLRAEEAMLKQLKTLAEGVDDPSVKSVLQEIAADEKRHHSGLRRLLDLASAKSTMVSEFWDTASRSMYMLHKP